jgi:hypothetical protein
MLMRPLLLPILAGLLTTAACAGPSARELPDVSAAAPARSRPAIAEPEKWVSLESSAGFEPRAAQGEY